MWDFFCNFVLISLTAVHNFVFISLTAVNNFVLISYAVVEPNGC